MKDTIQLLEYLFKNGRTGKEFITHKDCCGFFNVCGRKTLAAAERDGLVEWGSGAKLYDSGYTLTTKGQEVWANRGEDYVENYV